ncbi:phosphoglycerate mutase-like protein [Exidia glandulosa HHB12029]|uniref:Phosphoglycerate mutase-like protein n=1 Tax=Exidia glandulosa HHB12029 TaxID=1314781 RepID=A0A165L5L8_EXIGL|nr:phosphoglycerate mutase-like protein [Exidia glandulosa HHB12029]
MRVLITVAVAAVLVNAQQHVFETTNVGEYEDDFADWSKKWSAIKHAGRPTSVAYPPATLSTPSVAFPTPTGFAGPVAQGDEAIAAMESSSYPPPQHGPVVAPVRTRDAKKNFDAPAAWGNLSPYNSLSSIPSNSNFPPTSPAIPHGCSLSQLHVLHRHGIRYPELNDPPYEFAQRLAKNVKKGKGFTARGELKFLNTWRYRLGAETLAPLGRAQMVNLGISLRMKYGGILKSYADSGRLPVFRTTSQDRMLHSALNFAAGFFGVPYEDMYHQLVTIEEKGYNNTLAPHKICEGLGKAGKGAVKTWTKTFLEDARERLRLQIDGFELKTKDVFGMLQLCAYETLALGTSPFCALFTAEEHAGLGYAADLRFHAGSFGTRVGPANGIGWVRELIARLDGNRTSLVDEAGIWGLNSTIVGDEARFPLDGPLFVDATHDTTIAGALAAMNLTSLSARILKHLPRHHIPSPSSHHFSSARTVPFGANLIGQVLTCRSEQYVRWVLNDVVLPLHGSGECPQSALGMCRLDVFLEGLRIRVKEVEFGKLCGLKPDEEGGDDDEEDEEDE